MPRYRDPLKKAEQLLRNFEAKGLDKDKINAWQLRWRDKGPVKFAEQLLTCPLDVPPHPDFNPDRPETNPIIECGGGIDCPFGGEHYKFRYNGIPYHIILSSDEKRFLNDLWSGKVTQALVAAARGTGKTFCLAIWNAWLIACNDNYKITCMGGSSDQSDLVQEYIDDWRIDVVGKKSKIKLRDVIHRSLKGIKHVCHTIGRSLCRFTACSTLSARGKHVNCVEIDEACLAPDNMLLTTNGFAEIDDNSGLLDREILKSFVRKHDGEVVHVQPRYYGIGFDVTPNHPFWAIKRNIRYWFGKEKRFMPSRSELYRIKHSKNRDGTKKEPQWIKAGDLRKNDILVSPIPKRTIDNRLSPSNDFLRLVGYYIAEGSTGDHQIFISFNNNEVKLIKDVIDIVYKIFGIRVSKRTQGNCTSVYWTDKHLKRWFEGNCGHGAKHKKIPEVLMKLSDEQIDEVLGAIYAGDGYIIPRRKSLHIASKTLVYQILFIENSRGKLLCLHKEKDRDCYYLDSYPNKYGWVKDGFFYVPIYKVEKRKYSGRVYNFKTNTHDYLLPYALVHNCEAEDKSEDGAKAVAAVQWQTTGKRDGILILTSTAHYIHGMFYEYMTKPEFGFTVYRWALAKHISGETDPLKVYTDKNPNNWIPNVWWITQKEVSDKRRTKSDEEWLCEALGGASMASGAVFQKTDLDVIICGVCDECEPYNWEKCPMVQQVKLGTKEDPIKYILDRKAGFDYGVSDSPCALTIVGMKGGVAFVLFNDEQIGIRENEKVDWIDDNMNTFETFEFIPDPAASGKHLNEPLEDKGKAVIIIAEQEKASRVANVINFVEKHRIVVPKAFWYLTQSLKKLAWKDNKIRKVGDHSFDSLQYAMSDYSLESEGNVLDEFLKMVGEKKKSNLNIDEVYGVK